MRASSRLLSAVANAARTTLRPEVDSLIQRLHTAAGEPAVSQAAEFAQVAFGRRFGLGFAAAMAAGLTLSSCDDGHSNSPVMDRERRMWEEDAARRKNPLLGTADPNRIQKAIDEAKAKAAAAAKFTPTAPKDAAAKATPAAPAAAAAPKKPTGPRQVIFVLGGPGSGKGTQCSKLLEEFDMAHLSAGDLLRAHINSGSEDGNMVAEMIKEGKIVPSEVTVALLQKAMDESGKSVILIDGFPRNLENRDAFERVAGYDCVRVLFFDCPEDVLEARLLARNQGRTDDNIESIKKRFHTFVESSLPVIQYYSKLGKVKTIDTNRPIEEIYEEVKSIFEVVDE